MQPWEMNWDTPSLDELSPDQAELLKKAHREGKSFEVTAQNGQIQSTARSPDEIGAGKKPWELGWDYTPPETKPEQGDFLRGGKVAFQQLPQLGYGVAAGAAAAGETAFGEGGLATSLKNWAIKGYKEWGDKIESVSKPSDSFTYSLDEAKGGNIGALVDWLQYGLGYAGGQAVQLLATAGVGSLAAKATLGTAAKTLAEGMISKEAARIAATEEGKALTADALGKIATANVANKIGQTAAIGAMAFGQEGGEIFGDLAQQNQGRSLTGQELAKAFGATLAAGGLEFVGDKLGLDLLTGKLNVIGGKAGRLARGTAGAALAAPIEGGTEYLQTGIEEWGKGNEANMLPFNQSAKAQAGAFDAAALGAVGGMAMGGVGGAIHTPSASEVKLTGDTKTDLQNLNSAPITEVINPQEAEHIVSRGTFSSIDELANFAASEKEDLANRKSGIAADNALKQNEFSQFVNSEQVDSAYRQNGILQDQQKQADFPLAEEQRRAQAVDQANALTRVSGFDSAEPTAMQLAMQRAVQKKPLSTERGQAPIVNAPAKVTPNENIQQAAAPVPAKENTPTPASPIVAASQRQPVPNAGASQPAERRAADRTYNPDVAAAFRRVRELQDAAKTPEQFAAADKALNDAEDLRLGIQPAKSDVTPQFTDYAEKKSNKKGGVIKGQIVTFSSKDKANLYASKNKVSKQFTPRHTPDGWVLSKAYRERTPAQKANDARLKAASEPIDILRDEMQVALRKNGGIDIQEALDAGFDQADIDRGNIPGFGNRKLFRKGGMTMDGARELLAQGEDYAGYLDPNQKDDLDHFIERLKESVQDQATHYTFAAQEFAANLSGEAKALADMQAEQELSQNDLEAAGFTELSQQEQAKAQSAWDDFTDAESVDIHGQAAVDELNAVEKKARSKYNAEFDRSRAKGTNKARSMDYAEIAASEEIYYSLVTKEEDRLLGLMSVRQGISIADANKKYNAEFVDIEKSFSTEDALGWLAEQAGIRDVNAYLKNWQEDVDQQEARLVAKIEQEHIDAIAKREADAEAAAQDRERSAAAVSDSTSEGQRPEPANQGSRDEGNTDQARQEQPESITPSGIDQPVAPATGDNRRIQAAAWRALGDKVAFNLPDNSSVMRPNKAAFKHSAAKLGISVADAERAWNFKMHDTTQPDHVAPSDTSQERVSETPKPEQLDLSATSAEELRAASTGIESGWDVVDSYRSKPTVLLIHAKENRALVFRYQEHSGTDHRRAIARALKYAADHPVEFVAPKGELDIKPIFKGKENADSLPNAPAPVKETPKSEQVAGEYTGPTMAEVEKIQDIPTVEKMQRAIAIVGEKEFERRYQAKIAQYKPDNPNTEAMLVEATAIEIIALDDRKNAAPPAPADAGVFTDAPSAQPETAPSPGAASPTIATIPQNFLKRIQVDMPVMEPDGSITMEKRSAKDALDSLNRQEEAYTALRECVG